MPRIMKGKDLIVSEYITHRLSTGNETQLDIKSSADAERILRKQYRQIEVFESFYCVYMNSANNVVAIRKLSEGGISGTVADIRLIFKYALDHLATGIILSHNHPSGNLKPSQADLHITKQAKEAGEVLSIKVLDHIILSPDDHQYYSMADSGEL